jgi:pimeloyl-ACP methyl ester carboxylesterase
VLVHGAWHGPWCWAPVLAGLDDLGIPTVAVELAGPDLHADADLVRGVLDDVGTGGAVLAGHSYGGMVITDAGTHPAVEHLVYVCAFAPVEGETAVDAVAPFTSDLVAAVEVRDDGTSVLDPSLVAGALYADCDALDVERAVGLLRPQPMAALAQAPRAVAWRERPATYVLCSEDRALPAELQRDMAARIPDVSVIELPGASHSPFFSRAKELVGILAVVT